MLPPVEAIFRYVEHLVRHTPLWLFLATFAIQSVPFSPVPSYIPLVFYTLYHVRSSTDLAAAVFVSAAGAIAGKIVVFLFGDWLKPLMPRKSRETFRELLRSIPEDKLSLALFLMAALPLPDDEVYILLRAGDYDLRKLLIVITPAKILWAFSHVMYIVALRGAIAPLIGGGPLAEGALVSAVMLALTVAALRADWSQTFKCYRSHGAVAAVKTALKSIVRGSGLG